MTITSLGDLASSVQLRRQSGQLKNDLARLTHELSSGVTSDVVARLNGDLRPLSAIEQGIARVESYRSVIEEYSLVVTTQSLVFDKLRDFGTISDVLRALPDSANQMLIQNAGADALSNFSSAVSAMNAQSGGRTVFSGTATDQNALADAETILLALESEIALAGAVTATDVEAVVTAWFAPGGAFDTIGYLGGPMATTSLQLSDTELSTPVITAQDPAIRDQLAALAQGALLGRDVLSGDLVEQGALARLTGERLITTNDQTVAAQASLGARLAQSERASVEIRTQSESLEIARANLIEADPYDTAVRLQNAEVQLQTVYSITARLSRLSLVEYL